MQLAFDLPQSFTIRIARGVVLNALRLHLGTLVMPILAQVDKRVKNHTVVESILWFALYVPFFFLFYSRTKPAKRAEPVRYHMTKQNRSRANHLDRE